MSLRKFMHSRNKYKTAPDFKQLALLYPEFRKVAITDLTGKVKIDFKNEESLRVLTEILLKHDFGLEVKIPPNKLVPTLPLRLNYVLWIEDLINHASFTDMEGVTGIDIGTGAVCIYPLLFAKMYGSRMIGTEVDKTSVQTAKEQVEKNNLQSLINVIEVNEGAMLKDIIKEKEIYHFSMCNPPFFEAENMFEKTLKRLPPRNAPTGSEGELTIQGGERTFVTKMIEESIEIKERVKIYTTMFGQKSNLLYLIKLLKIKSIENITWTEFCQGHTTRWGLAWTFLSPDIVDLTCAPVVRKSEDLIWKVLKDQLPVEIVFPIDNKFSSLDDVVSHLQESLKEINIAVNELDLPVDNLAGWACKLTAESDTWSHARRKRRLMQRRMNESSQEKVDQACKNGSVNTPTSESNITSNLECTAKEEKVQTCTESTGTVDPLLVCSLYVKIQKSKEPSKKDNVRICLVFEKGSGGKNALETFKQYLINKLNVREYQQKQTNRPNKRKRKRLKIDESNLHESDANPAQGKREKSSVENSADSS